MHNKGFTSTREKDNESFFSLFSNAVEAKARHGRAFTLIETLVAISVLLISLAGPLSIAIQSLNSAYYARDQITAFYLAQEAIEYVRSVRDQNYLTGNPWLTGLDSGLGNCVNAQCTVNFPDFTHEACSGACGKVLVNPVTSLFGDDVGNESIYTRVMTIVPVTGTSDEVVVRVTVSWQSSGIARNFTIDEHMLNWLAP